jgi:hypothetical protein
LIDILDAVGLLLLGLDGDGRIVAANKQPRSRLRAVKPSRSRSPEYGGNALATYTANANESWTRTVSTNTGAFEVFGLARGPGRHVMAVIGGRCRRR